MDKEKKLQYARLFLELLSEGIIVLKFKKQSTGILSEVNLEHKVVKHNPSFNAEEFLKVCFSILNSVRDSLTTEKEEIDEDLSSIVQELLETYPSIKEDINIKSSSNLDILDSTDYEILTKRDKNDIRLVAAYSILLNIKTIGNNEEGISRQAIELTRSEVNNLIKSLEKALDDIRELEGASI